VGRHALVVVAPTECDARSVRALWRLLRPLGVRVGVTTECHGEARAEHGRPLFPDCLLIEVRSEAWDALIFAGGQGAARVAEDQVARELARRFAAEGRIVAALGDGRRVLSAARLEGFATDDPAVLLAHLARSFGLKEYPQPTRKLLRCRYVC
jgi:putative intracellular protease/amidase